jgi:hypothetical protein
VVHSYLAGPEGARTPETVDWSQTRYLDYAYLSIAVRPAPPGGVATMQVTALSDLGNEIDRVDLLRAVPRSVQG